jgi:hypothetical protein
MTTLDRVARIRLGLAFSTALATACQTKSVPTGPPPQVVDPVSETPTSRDYEQANTADQLSALMRTDLERHDPRAARSGLEAFAFAAIAERHAMYADALLTESRPVLSFQRFGGDSHITALKELVRILSSGAKRELADVYAALAQDDIEAISRARHTERAVLHPDTVRLSSQLKPHAHFIDGVLAYAELERQPTPTPGSADPTLKAMERATDAFARQGLDEPLFLALVISAEALELSGEPDRAIEKWLQAAEASYWERAHPDLRVAIRGRIQSYTDLLHAEVERDVQRQWEARVRAIEAAAKRDQDKAEARIVELEADLHRQRDRMELLEAEALDERAAVQAQIGELEGRLDEARSALKTVMGDAGERDVSLQDVSDGVSVVANAAWLAQLLRGGLTRRAPRR